jgi:hypothetical protein
MVSNEQSIKKEDSKNAVKDIAHKFSDGFRNGKYVMLVIVLLLLATIAFSVWMFLKAYFDTKNLNERSQELYNLKNYNVSILNSNSFVRNEIVDMKNLDELIDYNVKLQ